MRVECALISCGTARRCMRTLKQNSGQVGMNHRLLTFCLVFDKHVHSPLPSSTIFVMFVANDQDTKEIRSPTNFARSTLFPVAVSNIAPYKMQGLPGSDVSG